MLWCLDCPLFRPFRCDNSLSLLSRTGLETAVSKVPLAGQGGSASQTEGQQGQARLSKQAQGYVFLRRRTQGLEALQLLEPRERKGTEAFRVRMGEAKG